MVIHVHNKLTTDILLAGLLQSLPAPEEGVKHLIDILIRSDNRQFDTFCDVLHDVKQSSIVRDYWLLKGMSKSC